MFRLVLITLTLYGYWLLLSGHYTTWLNVMGFVCAAAIVAFCAVKGIIDDEGFPIEFVPGGILYWPWLAWEIVKSGLNVTRIVLDPRLPITPKLVRTGAKQKTATGIATYANSITLTPGTISVELSERQHAIWVHAITADGAKGLEADEMDDRVRSFEERRPL